MKTLSTFPTAKPHTPRPGAIRKGLHRIRAAMPIGSRSDYPALIDVKAASEILNVPVSWLLNRARAGRIPHHRLGHYVRFSQEDLQQITAEARITPDNIGVHVR